MRLGILDQAPISSGQTAKEALNNSMKLAQIGEKLGYTRYWIAEHHDISGLACSAPEVMLSYIGANTKEIRLGCGAVLLPHYKPYKVAEVYNMLATLFPGRIDLGIGRAPGGSAEATNALSDNYLQQVWNMPTLVHQLLQFIDDDFVSENPYASLSATPVPPIAPIPWLLGTSGKSAELAAENGMPYAFGKFMSDRDGIEITRNYRKKFKQRKTRNKPEVILTVSVICAESDEKAEELALSSIIWSLQREEGSGKQGVPSIEDVLSDPIRETRKDDIEKIKQNMIIGNPQKVSSKIRELQRQYHADEMMIVTITHSPEAKVNSYRLLANQLL